MGIFGKQKRELPPLMSEEEIDALADPVNFDSVVSYLEGLSRSDYEKLLKVVNIYRNANKDVNKVLGIQNEPVVKIGKFRQGEPEPDDEGDGEFLNDEDVAELKAPPK